MNDLSKALHDLSPKQRAVLELRLRQHRAERPRDGIGRQSRTSDLLPLSFAQQRLWFIDQLQPGSTFFNIRSAVRLTGQLATAALEQSLTEIIRRHDVLRTTFKTVEGQAFQVIDQTPRFKLPFTDLGELPAAARQVELRRLIDVESSQAFDLAVGPLLRARLIRLAAEEHILLFTIHHIISDGWGMNIIIQEVATLYEALLLGRQ